MNPAVSRKAWRKRYDATIHKLNTLRGDIDQLGEDGGRFVFSADKNDPEKRSPDEIACYASNCLEGVRSLMSDMWQRVVKQGDPNK
jgi:hypothetical protein